MEQSLYDRMAAAYAATTVSSARNRLHALQAERKGWSRTAALLHAIAIGEEIQARRILMSLRGKIQEIPSRMRAVIEEKEENASLFAQLQIEAESERWPVHKEMFDRLSRVSRLHGSRLKKHLASPDESREAYFVCRSCGYIAVGAVPEKCPVCNAVPSRFTKDIGA